MTTLERAVAIEIRAAELVAISLHSGRANRRWNQVTAVEFDWLVHGDWPPHSPTQRWPETDEEAAALLAHDIELHDHLFLTRR